MTRGELQPNVSPFDALASFPLRFWAYIVVTGIGAGLGGGLLMQLLYATERTAWNYSTGSFLEGVEKCSAGWRVSILFLTGLLVGVGCWLLQRAGGHGGELSAVIWFESGKLPTLKTMARAVLSIVAVGMGASIGREASLKQMGAAVSSRLSGGGRLPAPQRRLLVACGAGAGMAVAYNVPFGSALFALEVLLGELSIPLVIPALFTSSIATAVSWAILPNRPTYIIPDYELTIPLVVWAAACGPLFGACSAFYVRFIGWADAHKPTGWKLLVAPVVMLTALGAASIAFPQLLGNGKDVVQLAFASELSFSLFLILPLLKVLATGGTLGCGAPGGLFTPTITFGALLGGLLGGVWGYFWPGSMSGAYALVGAGAVLAAASQGPLSATVFMIELTRRLDPLMVPVLISVGGAVLVARAIDSRSVYTSRIHTGQAAAATGLITPTAFDAWISGDYETVSAAEHYAELLPRLLRLQEKGWPLYVIGQYGQMIGEVDLTKAGEEAKLVPLQMATAGDLATPVPVLKSDMTPEQVQNQIKESGRSQLPVIDAATGLLLGIARTPADR